MASVMEKTEGMKYLLAVRALRWVLPSVPVRTLHCFMQCVWCCLVAAIALVLMLPVADAITRPRRV